MLFRSDICTRTQQIFRGIVNLWGSEIYSDAGGTLQIQFVNPGVSEIAGCIFRSNGAYIIGNDTVPALDVYNSTFGSLTTGHIVQTMSVRDSDNFVIAGLTPSSFIQATSVSLIFRGGILIGAPTVSDIRWAGALPQNWRMVDVLFSDTPGIPRFTNVVAGTPTLANATQHYVTYNTKVGNKNGFPLANVPIRLESDIEGLLADTRTFGDGDIGFANTTTGIDNTIRVRDSYISSGSTLAVRDRIFTVTVNGPGGAFPQLPNYETRRIVFGVPGQEVLRGAYSPGGGAFRKIEMPIMLNDGDQFGPVILEECSL